MSDHEDLNLLRSTPLDSSRLQAEIIAKTENMPQYAESKQGVATKTKNWRRYLQVLTPIAACAVIAVIVVMGPNTNDEQAANQLASEELEWREMMLTEDAWLLADL